MTEVYDVAIVGAGGMGSAAAWALAKARRDVVVLEQYELGHTRGGSHGATRIFRVGTEQSHYLAMAERARTLWSELASETGADLLTMTGAVEHGMGLGAVDEFSDLLTSRGIDHDVLDAAAAAERWPGMRFDGPVLHQSGGGILHADRVVSGLQRLAVEHGATVRAGARVVRVSLTDGGAPVLLATDDGSVLARHVIVTVGPWVHRLLAGVVPLPSITVTQEQPRIFEPHDDAAHEAGDWPCFVHWRDDDGDWGRHESYGLYEAGAGVKVGLHASGPEIDPDRRDFTPEPERDDALRAYVRDWFPGLDPDRSTPISCLYDNTDNGDFVIDRFGPLTVATGFNGEGFKFVPVVGELLRDLAIAAADPPAMFTVARHLTASTQRPASVHPASLPSRCRARPVQRHNACMRPTPPTAELHVHLEGTLEPEAIFAMAASKGMPAPSTSIDALRAKYEFDDLQSFLDIYYGNLDVVRTADDFYAMTDAYLRRAAAGNVRRAEMFFDPQSHLARGVRVETMLEGITAAMRDHPEVSTGLIMCFLRHLGPDAAIDTYRLMAAHLGDIAGVGLDSTEIGYPNQLFAEVYAMARADGLHAVAHAGEEGGPDNIVASLDVLGAERIDHGVRCLEDDRLVDRLVAQQIPLTVCPQSNVRLKVVSALSDHPLPQMLERGLCVTVNSDDPAYFGGYVDDNYRAAAAALDLSAADVRTLAENSFAASFIDDHDRAGFLAEVSDYFAGDG